MKIKGNKFLIFLLLFFGIFYCDIALLNHYNFRTYPLDLGLYTNALYDYIHFQWNDSSVFKDIPENLLADHFDLYLVLFSPLSLIFKSYTLLVVQIFFVLLGGIGVYKYFSDTDANSRMPLFAAVYFYLFFGVYTALAFDYHSNVVAAMAVPWFFYFVRRKKFVLSFLVLVFILISKENMSLWAAFICLGLLVRYRKDKPAVRFLLLSFSISVIYFILIVEAVMPAFSNSGSYYHFNYSCLGANSAGALKFLITHPVESIKTLFINHNHTPGGDYVKAELHILLLVSGLYFLFFKPEFFIMLIPVYFQKLFNDNYSMWGINGQYSIEFAPVLAIGIFSVISEFKNTLHAKWAMGFALVGCFVSTIRVMDDTVFPNHDRARIRIYKASHYTRDYDVSLVHEQLDRIPADVVVSAQTSFLPHLAWRDKIYEFPVVKDAAYVVYSPKENTYSLSTVEANAKIEGLLNSGDWGVYFKNEDLVVLKRALSR